MFSSFVGPLVPMMSADHFQAHKVLTQRLRGLPFLVVLAPSDMETWLQEVIVLD